MIGNEQLDALERLHRLREAGALTDAEFAAGKARVLAGETPPRPIAAPAPRMPIVRDGTTAKRSTTRYWIGGSLAALALLVGGAWLLFPEPLVPVANTPTHRTAKAAHARPEADGTAGQVTDLPSPLPAAASADAPPEVRSQLSTRSDDTAQNASRAGDVPSLDGGYIYRLMDRYATSAEVVQVRRADGRTRDVIDGNSVSVIRTGPYRGYLLVSRHKYRDDGAYNPIDLVRPDGKVVTTLPDCDDDDDGSCARSWLDAHGWSVS